MPKYDKKSKSRHISASLKGHKLWLGKHHSDKSKVKIGLKHLNKPLSTEHRAKIGAGLRGIKHGEEWKTNCRKSFAERLKLRGGNASVDHGATGYFNELNSRLNLHIQHPNVYFNELGYWADGYDFTSHTWYEYDSPTHLRPGSFERDLKRQNRIIEHFKSIGKPLTAFYRFNATGKGEPGLHNVLTNI